jgi:fatty-acyl-CoA synthase
MRANMDSGTLFVVATPIGNLADLSARARSTLEGVALIAAEDTRHTGAMLATLGIDGRTTPLHEHNEERRVPELLERLRAGDAEQFDLRRWRIAGCGADMIRPEILERFAEALAPGGFDGGALMPSYGMAEVSLAVSFTRRGTGVHADAIDMEARETTGEARPADADTQRVTRFTCCGVPLPGYEVEIRDADGSALSPRLVGSVHLRTPSTMEGYHGAPEINRQILVDGWLDTGDLGYFAGEELVITGRRKDLMIINGRNIWPQDVEQVAEQFQGVRTGDAAAFTIDADDGNPALVLMLQCREQDDDARERLLRGIRSEIQAEFGIDPRVTPVAPHSLPRTTSGKLSRARARSTFLDEPQ